MEQDTPLLRFYGRRKGKIIRKGRADAYDVVMPEVGIALPAENTIVDSSSFFSAPVREVWLEIGFGNGEQMVYQALDNPNIGIIGCEPFRNGIANLCRDIKEQGIKNIRIWPDDARLLMQRLKDNSIARCFLLNSDPWPKTRHHKRRFVQKETLDELQRLLKPGAEFRMSSDHAALTCWQLEKTYFHGGFSWDAQDAENWRNRPTDMTGTRYQQKGAGHGRPTVFLNFRKR